MKKVTFGQLAIGDSFYKEGFWMKKIETIRSGGCGCPTANAQLIDENPNPLRIYQDSEEVEIPITEVNEEDVIKEPQNDEFN